MTKRQDFSATGHVVKIQVDGRFAWVHIEGDDCIKYRFCTDMKTARMMNGYMFGHVIVRGSGEIWTANQFNFCASDVQISTVSEVECASEGTT